MKNKVVKIIFMFYKKMKIIITFNNNKTLKKFQTLIKISLLEFKWD